MANWKSKAIRSTTEAPAPIGMLKTCLNSPEEAAVWMVAAGVEEPRHDKACQALRSGDLATAEAIGKDLAKPGGEVWPFYVLAVADWFGGRPMRALARAMQGLDRRAAHPTDAHYQSMLRQVQTAFTARVPSLLARAPQPRLSVCLITKNEEAHLEKCLRSIQMIADEIVVVDTGSTDGTVAIAKQYGARVGVFDWIDDFAAARNAALDLATGDWVLSIDADEWLSESSRQPVRVCLHDLTCSYLAISKGAHGGQSFANTRLFPRVGARWEGRLHEDVTFEDRDILLVPLSALVLNTGADETMDKGAKAARNLRIIEQMRSDSEQTPEVLDAYAAMTAVALTPGDPGAISRLKEVALVAAPWRSRLSRLIVMTLASNLIQCERFEEALEVADLAEQYQLDGLWSSYLRSRYAFMQGNREEAHLHAERGLSSMDQEGPVARMRADLQVIFDSTK